MKKAILTQPQSDWPRLGVALLAAGSSKRFGAEDKLAAPLHGRALGEYAAEALPMVRAMQGWAIVSRPRHRCEAFWRDQLLTPVINDKADQGMGTSVALAADLAKRAKCDALLIALADMPFVPRSHFDALIDAFASGWTIATSAKGSTHMPPAIFDAANFDELKQSSGDKGARDLLAGGGTVACPPEWLIDIDTPEMLQKHGQPDAAGLTKPRTGDQS